MGFVIGDRVEVSSGEEGFVGSYYSGKIVSDINEGSYVVEYKNLLKDDMSGPLDEVVPAGEIRPLPPTVPVTGFVLRDRVDAFANDGWWEGTITGAKRSRSVDWYYVFFERSSGDEIAYPASRIRVHLDWVDGKWVSANKEKN